MTTIEEFASGLTDLLAGERKEIQRLRHELELAVQRERRLTRAVAALAGEPQNGEHQNGKKKPPKKKAGTGKWTPSQGMLTAVENYLLQHQEGRASEIAAEVEVSTNAVRNALVYMRDNQKVRLKRQSTREGKVYALMPS